MDRNGNGGKSPNPTKTGNWLWAQGNKHNLDAGGVENDGQNTNPPVIIDVFQEREGGGGMRVGRDYQAKIPNVIPDGERNVQAENDKALLVWKPTEKLSDDEVEEYISMAKEKFQYTGEQALGLLYWHRYDIQRATQDLGNFTPHPEEWTIEDKVLFEQAFQFHGKCFDKIRQMLPDKSMSSLIRYYYNWKKHKNKSSVMDRQVKKFSQEDEDSLPGTNGSGILSISHNHQNNISSNLTHHLHHASMSIMQDGFHSESDDEKPTGVTPIQRNFLRLTGMNINHDDLTIVARSQPLVEGIEKEIESMKYRIQTEKQRVELLRRGLPEKGLKQFRPKEGQCPSNNRVNSRWTQEELMLAAQGIRRYGKNFQKIAAVIGTKTEVHIKSFFANYRRRYGLELLIQEHQLENPDTDEDLKSVEAFSVNQLS